MLSSALAFLIALLVAALLIPPIRRMAATRGLLDEPGGRKIHAEPVPRLGGVAIAAGVYLGIIGVLLAAMLGLEPPSVEALPALLVGGAILVVAGMVDDVAGLAPLAKLAAQAAAAIAAFALGLGPRELTFPWGTLELGWAAFPVTLLWIVGVINAINLIDGLDGLAAGIVVVALVAFFVIGRADAPIALLAAVGTGATLGFLIYNIHPASIIMGDTGSMFLGYLVALAAIRLISPFGSPATGPVAAYVPLVVLALPLADMAWVAGRRAIGGRSIFAADAGHVHHRLLRRGISHPRAVVLLIGVSLVAAVVGIGLARLG
jgi:UDP-GlcNAc:undecaprenyl-phosphate GlcNAc-1-phosphate transferase